MDEKLLGKISLGVVLIGLTVLFFYTENIELDHSLNLENIPIDEEVKIKGEIKSLRKHENTFFLEISGERVETVDVVLFNDEDIFLEEGNYVEIKGKIEEYKGKKEIIAGEIFLK